MIVYLMITHEFLEAEKIFSKNNFRYEIPSKNVHKTIDEI